MADETMMTGELNTDPAEGGQAQGAATDPANQPPQEETPPAADPATAPQEKPEGEEGAKEGEGEKEGEKPEIPEKYEFKAPEGFEGELDQAALEQFEPIAKELGLTQEQADKLVSMHADSIQRASTEARDQWAQQQQTWREDLQNDPEFGGQKFQENVTAATKAVERFGSPGLKEALESTGMGNHPELVRTFAAIGKAISEDKLVMGNQSQGQRSIEERLYPNMKS